MLTGEHRRFRLGAAAAALATAVVVSMGASPASDPVPAAAAAPATGAKGKKPSKAERRRKMRRANRRQKRPNVIVVMTDDQDASMTGLDTTTRLVGSRGTTFSNSYVSFPLCCPARASFLTGQYAHNHRVTSTELPNGYGALDHSNTLAVWLKRAGYRTAMVGKYLNGYGLDDEIRERVSDRREIPPGWSDFYALTADKDQRRYRYWLNEDGKIVKYKGRPKDYVTDVLAGKAIDLVKDYAPHPKPFFLWFNPTAPHGEQGRPFGSLRNPQPAPRHLGDFEGALRPRTPNFNEDDVSDKPALIQNIPKLSASEVLDIDLRYRGRVESLLSVDDAVKRLIGRVRKADDLGKTYIFFTSDNGLMMGAHRLILKNHMYEEDTRVPLMVRGPKFPRGVVRDQFVSNVDLAPTITQLTGAKPRLTMDGRSLVPVAKDATAGAGREVLFEITGGDAGIRQGRWVFLERGPVEGELYDLDADPFQLTNLLGAPGHPTPAEAAVRDQLRNRLLQLKTCAGTNCP